MKISKKKEINSSNELEKLFIEKINNKKVKIKEILRFNNFDLLLNEFDSKKKINHKNKKLIPHFRK